jgi:wyosine [tRNA(Phe)-imidazoG37] synthetase (radical SAM superfamily)
MNTTGENTFLSKAVAPTTASAAFGLTRDFLGHRFVYVVISSRARGLSAGVNLNPNRECNFNCMYCEVDRYSPPNNFALDLDVMSVELQNTVDLVTSNRLRFRPAYANLSDELLRLRHLALSGDGEPTLCPQFGQAVETVVHVRATSSLGFFKIVLITNASNLDAAEVQDGLRLLTRRDEIWVKLDAGTQAYMERVNNANVCIEKILSNILLVARQRPVIIQSLFPALDGHGPSDEEIARYAQRLLTLKQAGAQIALVQIYSAARPTPSSTCGHLPLPRLSQIARAVRGVTGLNAEVF